MPTNSQSKEASLRELIKKNQLQVIRDTINALPSLEVSIKRTNANQRVIDQCGLHSASAELLLRRYIIHITTQKQLFLDLAYSIQKKAYFTYPLPASHVEYLSKNGILVSKNFISVRWRLFVVFRFLQNLIKSFLILPKSQSLSKQNTKQPYIQHLFLPPGRHLDSPEHGSNFIQHYHRKKNVASHKNEDNIHSNITNQHEVPYPYLIRQSFFQEARKCLFLFQLIKYSVTSLIQGDNFIPLLFLELFKAFCASQLESTYFPCEYWVPYSGETHKPLWLQVAENNGATVYTWCYSTWETPTIRNQFTPLYTELYLCPWKHMLVWDRAQAKLFSSYISNLTQTQVEIVGPLCLSPKKSQTNLPPNTVSVFDLSPHTQWYPPATSYDDFFFHSPRLHADFLQHTYHSLSSAGLFMAYKPKKLNRRNYLLPEYVELLRSFENLPFFLLVDPNLSSIQLVQETIASVSMCFTSAALIGPSIKKQSIYYDPTTEIDPLDPASHGLEILQSAQALSSWCVSLTSHS